MSIVRRNDPWIQTYSGLRVPFFKFGVEHVALEDIRWSLAMTCRFTGHVREFYSVAQHCVWVTQAVKEKGGSLEAQRQALLHDSSEAYLADVAAPYKRELGTFVAHERRIETICYEAFGLPGVTPDIVHQMDRLASFVEARQLSPGACEGSPDYKRLKGALDREDNIMPLMPVDARRVFARECKRLDITHI